MSEKVTLKAMRCPTCGGSLKAENNTDAIVCVYCGNTIVPVNEATAFAQREVPGKFNGVLRVDGIKTSSSALAYMELFFEEYDWEAFSYAQALSISEIDKLANSLKSTSADDKNTWFVCFNAISVPFLHKISGCQQLIASVIDEYKNDNLDAYSKFDAYKRISTMIDDSKNKIVENLEKIITNAVKYGASTTEIGGLKSDLESIKARSSVDRYTEIEDIPEIKFFIADKNTKIAAQLAGEGINANDEYLRAKALIDERKYVEALDILRSLRGYCDSNLLIDKIDKYYLISDILEIEGTLYYFKKESFESNALNLHPTIDGKISQNAIVKEIGNIITNYADILYYLDVNNHLKRFNLSLNTEEKITDENSKEFGEKLQKDSIHVVNRKAFLVTKDGGEYSDFSKDIVELDLTSGTVKTVIEDIKEIVSLTGNKMIYTTVDNYVDGAETDKNNVRTNIVNVDTMEIIEFGLKKITVEGFINNSVVYTQASPNEFNKNLYIRSFDSDDTEILIESNIYRFCDIIDGKLFYYVGNSRNQSLININCDGTGRKEWPLYISRLLFEQGGWLYFIRKAGYTAVLCKSRIDGNEFSIIATDIEEFIEIKNGYLYYINSASTLVKIRMDGSNLQELCDDVEEVLTVKEDKIIFVSVDGRIKTGELGQTTTKIVKSIYAVDFAESGKIKLAYNIQNAKKYDDNTVYYIADEEIKSSYDQLDKKCKVLYKLDVETNHVEKLLDLEIQKEESKLSGFAIAMIFMVIAFFIGFIGFAGEAPQLGVVGLLVGVVSLLIGVAVKANKNE